MDMKITNDQHPSLVSASVRPDLATVPTEPSSSRSAQSADYRPASQTDVISLSQTVTSEANAPDQQRVAKSVTRNEKNALLGAAGQQSAFAFYDDEARLSRHVAAPARGGARSGSSKPVTKKEKNALLDSSAQQYNFTFYG